MLVWLCFHKYQASFLTFFLILIFVLDIMLIDLCYDGTKESYFRDSYLDFWVKMLQDSEYESLNTIAVNKLVMIPTTYLTEKDFSVIVDIKNKKRNRLKMVDAWGFGNHTYYYWKSFLRAIK